MVAIAAVPAAPAEPSGPEGTAGRLGLARLEPGDGPRLERFFYRLSPETVYRRFHSPIARPEQARPEHLLDLDHHDREAVAAIAGGEIVGVARYFRAPGRETAEVSVVVADAWQRRGLARRLLPALAELARTAGIGRFTMAVQADNLPALRLLHAFDASAKLTVSGGVCEASVPTGGRGGPR